MCYRSSVPIRGSERVVVRVEGRGGDEGVNREGRVGSLRVVAVAAYAVSAALSTAQSLCQSTGSSFEENRPFVVAVLDPLASPDAPLPRFPLQSHSVCNRVLQSRWKDDGGVSGEEGTADDPFEEESGKGRRAQRRAVMRRAQQERIIAVTQP